MTDTKVTFLSCYNTVGHTRMNVMTLTSPPSLPLSSPWAGLRTRRFIPSHLLFQGSPLLSVLPFSASSGSSKSLTLSISTSLPTITRTLPGHTGQDPCLLSTLISLPSLQSLPDPKIPFKSILQHAPYRVSPTVPTLLVHPQYDSCLLSTLNSPLPPRH
jgi:hypothetical protein